MPHLINVVDGNDGRFHPQLLSICIQLMQNLFASFNVTVKQESMACQKTIKRVIRMVKIMQSPSEDHSMPIKDMLVLGSVPSMSSLKVELGKISFHKT